MENPNVIFIDVKQLQSNPYQPPGRLKITEDKARKGAESILRSGLLQIPVGRGREGVYEVGDGWQRKLWFEWLMKNGHPEFHALPVELRDFTDEDMADLIGETDDNKDKLNPIDRAWYYRKYLADFKKVTQAQFARRRGISQAEVANTIRLLDLPEKVQQMIISHEISESHGRSLLALKEPGLMIEYSDKTLSCNWSVATLESVIKAYIESHKPRLVEPTPPAPIEEKQVDETETHIEEKLSTQNEAGEEESEEATDEKDEAEAKKSSGPAGKKSPPKTPPKQEPPKKHGAPSKPAATPPTTAVKPVWKRKLVLEETDTGVKASIMAEGKFPVMDGFTGNLETVVRENLTAFLIDTNMKWEVK